MDIGVVTLITASFGGLAAMFVFYYPALLACALVLPTAVTAVFTLALIAVYALVALAPSVSEPDLQNLVVRLISLVAVAIVGNMYQGIERERREAQVLAATNQESKGDLFYGQVVLIMARWFLIAAGLILVLWRADTTAEVTLPIGFIIALMIMNFYLHGRYVMTQPVNAVLVHVSAALDLGVITGLTLFWTEAGGTGLDNPFFVLLYPVLLAFALISPPRTALTYAAVAIVTHIAVVAMGSDLSQLAAQKALLERVLTLAATAGLGAYFWRIQRERRREAAAAQSALLHDVETLVRRPGLAV